METHPKRPEASADVELHSRRTEINSNVADPPPTGTNTSIEPDTHNEAEQSSKLTTDDILKLVCAGFSFFFAGTNDGTIGPLIPYMLRDYHVSTGLVTVIYIASFSGWLVSAVTNTHLTTTLRLSLGLTLLLGAALQLFAQMLRFWFPPFRLFAVTFFFTALGQAYQDSYSNTFVAQVSAGAHRWLGFIHAMYMLGCLTGPFIATLVASNGQWTHSYAVIAGLGALNIIFVIGAFRQDIIKDRKKRAVESRDAETASHAEAETTAEEIQSSRQKQALQQIRQTLQLRAVWMLSLFYFAYLGAVITAGGWLVEYLVRVRGGDLTTMGYASTAMNGGSFVGRLLLAEPTHRFGERRMLLGYIAACVVLQIMFWRIPNIAAGFVLYAALGFFSGPFFAAGISVATRLCPKSLQSTALGLIFVLAQAGGSLFPTITGLIAARSGISVLQPMLVGLFCAVGLAWWFVPKAEKQRDQ